MTLKLSLAQWSLHRTIRSGAQRADHFPRIAKEEFAIDAVELVNTLLPGSSKQVFQTIRRIANDYGVRVLLIMVDDAGDLCHPNNRLRKKAVTNHYRWIDAAAFLGCHAVRVNTGGVPGLRWDTPVDSGLAQTALSRCLDSFNHLANHAEPLGVSVLIENHGGLSSNPRAVAELLQRASRDNLGTLPDFGNMPKRLDRYDCVERLLPYARGVSAKSYDFDADGYETTIDYARMMDLIRASRYSGHIGIEYEGNRLPEADGIRLSKALLEKFIEPEVTRHKAPTLT